MSHADSDPPMIRQPLKRSDKAVSLRQFNQIHQ